MKLESIKIRNGNKEKGKYIDKMPHATCPSDNDGLLTLPRVGKIMADDSQTENDSLAKGRQIDREKYCHSVNRKSST